MVFEQQIHLFQHNDQELQSSIQFDPYLAGKFLYHMRQDLLQQLYLRNIRLVHRYIQFVLIDFDMYLSHMQIAMQNLKYQRNIQHQNLCNLFDRSMVDRYPVDKESVLKHRNSEHSIRQMHRYKMPDQYSVDMCLVGKQFDSLILQSEHDNQHLRQCRKSDLHLVGIHQEVNQSLSWLQQCQRKFQQVLRDNSSDPREVDMYLNHKPFGQQLPWY